MIVSIVLSTALVSFFVMKIVTALRKKFNQSCGGNRDVETGPAEAGESSCLMQVSNTGNIMIVIFILFIHDNINLEM